LPWRLLQLRLLLSGRALLGLTNTGIRWAAAALQLQQLFTKGLNLQLLLLKRPLQFQQLQFKIDGRVLSQSRWYRQPNQSNDGSATKVSFSTSKKHQPPTPRI
jgi:hypothetical protein